MTLLALQTLISRVRVDVRLESAAYRRLPTKSRLRSERAVLEG